LFLEQPGQIAADLIITASKVDPDCDGSAIVDAVYNYTGDFELISYFWSPNPSGINGLGADTINGFCPGDHTLVVNDENGCSEVIGELANIDESVDAQFTLVSNSITGEIIILFDDFTDQLTFNVYETSGKLVYSIALSEMTTILNPNVGAGIYIYTIAGANSFLSKGKFVVTR
jgi:hypothetical protein